jgi:Icc-related predicted phosphoesterase
VTQFGIVGDVHGNFEALNRILTRHPEIPFWLCVGDLASNSGAYPEPAAPLYFIQGNNEGFDRLHAFRTGEQSVPNLHFIPNGTQISVGGVNVAGVGGTFAPTWYEKPAASLPVKGKDDKRRHFVQEEIEAAKHFRHIDVLLTHEAPKPFWIELPSSTAPSRKWRRDVGKEAVTALADAIQPRLHCFGHHHTFASFDRQGIATVCVDRVNRLYLLIDRETFVTTVLGTDDGQPR